MIMHLMIGCRDFRISTPLVVVGLSAAVRTYIIAQEYYAKKTVKDVAEVPKPKDTCERCRPIRDANSQLS